MFKKIISVLVLASVLASAFAVASLGAWHNGINGFKVLNAFTIYGLYAGFDAQPYTNTENSDFLVTLQYNTAGANGYSATQLRFDTNSTGSYSTTSSNWSCDLLIDFDNYDADTYQCSLNFSLFRSYSGNSYTNLLISKNKSYWENYRDRHPNYFSSNSDSGLSLSFSINTSAPKVHLHFEGFGNDSHFVDYLWMNLTVNSFNCIKDGSSLLNYEKDEAESQSQDIQQQAEDAQNDTQSAIDNTVNAFQTLGNAFSSSSTSVNSWKLPAMYIPATSVTPRIELSTEKNIDFQSWINSIPQQWMTIIKLICSIAIFTYCGKELISIISILINNRDTIGELSKDVVPEKKGGD